MTVLFTRKGERVTLGRELGKGGEGSVYETSGAAEAVAKVYHQPPSSDKARKLSTMVDGCTARLKQVAAWPTDTLSSAHGGTLVGFLMRKVEKHNDIHDVYGPKTRLRKYPDASYRFLVRVAANLARAYQVVHEHGHVVGDVNSGGACVSAQGTITLVDCDSFQIERGTSVFTCDVGIPIYQPAEFQGLPTFRGLRRTFNHDCFGLAVLVFQTLFLARHPFAGTFTEDGDMSIEQAIREFRFAYAHDAVHRKMRPPPGALQLGAVSTLLATLFERAFLEAGVRQRPAAREWVDALDAFESELTTCGANRSHAHAKSLHDCPLCSIEQRIGVLLFVPPLPTPSSPPAFDLDGLWHELVPTIARAENLNTALLRVEPRPGVPPARVETYIRQVNKARQIAWAVGVASVLLAFLLTPIALILILGIPFIRRGLAGPIPYPKRELRSRLKVLRDARSAIVSRIENDRDTHPIHRAIDECRAKYNAAKRFNARRVDVMREFEAKRSKRQMTRYLDRFVIADSGLKVGGPTIIARLQSYGIETAEDINENVLEGIRGIGPKRREVLLEWRATLESSFKPHPGDPQEATDRLRVERELQQEQSTLLAEFFAKAARVKAMAPQYGSKASELTVQVERANEELTELLAICSRFNVT